MENLTLEEHKKRIENIKSAEEGNRKYLRRHRINDYLPGQATYNLGDYPKRISLEPTEYDYNMLKTLKENGVELIQLHEEWNDAIRHLGADKYTSYDPCGLDKFIDLCHDFGIKIIPYVSSGFLRVEDPDFREDFARGTYEHHGDHLHYRKCFAGSPSWREYVLPRTFKVLDRHNFDGIYNDCGYEGWHFYCKKMKEEKGIDLLGAKSWDLPYDPEFEDLLSTIYTEIKRRGGIYKVHCDRNNAPPCKDKVYDYLWIGECVDSNDYGAGKLNEPYMVPCQDASYDDASNPDSYYAKVIPFMQFPLLKRGRPYTGSGLDLEGVEYKKVGDYIHKDKVRQYMKDHPEGPYVYSHWSTIPDDVNAVERFGRYMKLYKPMVERNSVVYIELSECDDILSPIPEKICASMFVNEEKYLVVSNLTNEDYTLTLKEEWTDRETNERKKNYLMKPGKIVFLMK